MLIAGASYFFQNNVPFYQCLIPYINFQSELDMSVVCINQGLSKHQEVSFTSVMKVTKVIVVFWDLHGATKGRS